MTNFGGVESPYYESMILPPERNSLQIQTKDFSCITRDIAIDVDIVMGNASCRVSKCPLSIISVKKCHSMLPSLSIH